VEKNGDGATVGSLLVEALGDILGPEGEALGTRRETSADVMAVISRKLKFEKIKAKRN